MGILLGKLAISILITFAVQGLGCCLLSPPDEYMNDI